MLERLIALVPNLFARAAIALIALSAMSLAVSIFPKQMLAAFSAALAIKISHTALRLYRVHKRSWARAVLRVLRPCRVVFRPAPAVHAAYLVAMVANLLVWSAGMLDHGIPNPIATTVAAFMFALVGFVDVFRIAIRLNRYAWAKWVGRFALAAVSVFSGWLASVVAEHKIANITHMSPEHFGVSVKLFAGLLTPAIYGGLCAIVVVALAAVAALIIVVCIGGYMNLRTLWFPFQEIWNAFSRRSDSTKPRVSFGYRIMNGKRPPLNGAGRNVGGGSSLALMRPIAILLAAYLAISLCDKFAQWDNPNRHHFASTAIAMGDFYGGHACSLMGGVGRVHYLDADNVIVAIPIERDWLFTKGQCNVKVNTQTVPVK